MQTQLMNENEKTVFDWEECGLKFKGEWNS